MEKHVVSKERLYIIWNGMRLRCYNEKSPNFPRYGGRGITICDEWRTDYEAFRKWALANGYREDLTIDRKENDRPYCPENCRWVSRIIQDSNKSNNRFIELHGEKHTISEWAKILDISENIIRGRLARPDLWTETEALTTPVMSRAEAAKRGKRKREERGETMKTDE